MTPSAARLDYLAPALGRSFNGRLAQGTPGIGNRFIFTVPIATRSESV